jgi:hypothetical protein
MIRLLKGYFGNFEGYALLGFEQVPIGPITGNITLEGQVNSAGCSFSMATFGSRL